MRGKRKKRAPFVIGARKDERAVESAWNQNAVVLGYDMDEKPWLWPDDLRVMQGIVLGMTGGVVIPSRAKRVLSRAKRVLSDQ